jgi:hypothetical protein
MPLQSVHVDTQLEQREREVWPELAVALVVSVDVFALGEHLHNGALDGAIGVGLPALVTDEHTTIPCDMPTPLVGLE